MNNPFPEHQARNLSCLEPFRSEIGLMRRSRWPYRRITEWLAEQGVGVSFHTVRQFCLRRGIANTPKRGQQRSTAHQQYGSRGHSISDGDKPIRTWKDES